MTERGEEAASLVNRLSLGTGSLSAEDVFNAFRPSSTSQARASIALQLSQAKEDLVTLLSARLSEALSAQNDNEEGVFAAVRLMTCLFSVAPQSAHKLLFESVIIRRILSRSADVSGQNYLLAFVTSELLSATANHINCRRWILSDYKGQSTSSEKIVEIDEASQLELTPMHWLMSFTEKANLENTSSGSLLSKVALLSSLALHKIRMESKKKDVDEQIDVTISQSSEAAGDDGETKREEDALLFELSKAHIISDEKTQTSLFDNSSLDIVLESSTREEMERACRLASVESLTYLTLDSFFRDAVVESQQLLVLLCQMAKVTDGNTDENAKTLFPQRGPDAASNTSLYELDKVLTSTDFSKRNGQDTALQYGLATLFVNIMTYPPLLSAEEKQMEKLKQMANAKTRVKGADKAEEIADPRMTIDAIEARIEKVLSAGGAEALTAISLGSAKTNRVNASLAIRETVSKALLFMTTRQNKLQRGKIIQQGGARALLTLSNQHIADVLRGKEDQGKPSFTAMQALAHLLITENPNLVLRDAAESIPSLIYLYFHSTSSRLQRFEAALALTNLASLGEVVARGIASCAFPRKVIESYEFAGAGAREASESKMKIIDVLHERIFLEDYEMSRRSSLELLCNLLVEDSIYKRWSGEEEDEGNASAGVEEVDFREGKTMKNLVFLIALCSPLGVDEASGEGGLKLRLAAAGAIATLCSSPSTCERLLSVETRILSKISRLVHSSTLGGGEGKEEEEEKELNDQDISEDPLGPHHAVLQLALRGLICLDSLLQYIKWLQGQGNHDVTLFKHKLIDSGCIDASKKLALFMVKAIKQANSVPAVQSIQEQVAQQSFESLRACKALGLL